MPGVVRGCEREGGVAVLRVLLPQPSPGAHRGTQCGGRSADRAHSYLGCSDQPPETAVQPAPPRFSHHVGFLGILRWSVGPDMARLREHFARVDGLASGTQRGVGRGVI